MILSDRRKYMVESEQSISRWLESEIICSLILYYHNHGKKMALWGAGGRGTAFLKLFDPHAEFFIGVYDMYPAKQGITMKT